MGTFIDAQQDAMRYLILNAHDRFTRALIADCRRLPVIPCPESIGNDPCDDVDPDRDIDDAFYASSRSGRFDPFTPPKPRHLPHRAYF